MNPFDLILASRLESLRKEGLHRQLRWLESAQDARIQLQGRKCWNFSSNDYLGLANEPFLREAFKEAVDRFGSGAGASRLICGSMAPHRELEESLAAFKGCESAIAFATGHAAAVGTLPALVGKGDVVLVDKLVHACLIDGARLSGATLRSFKHNHPDDLERLLQWAVRECEQNHLANPEGPKPQILVITESVFSMDGDLAPLRNIVELKDRYQAWLMVDEAHATGLFGERRSGLVEAMELSGPVSYTHLTLPTICSV